MPIRVLIVDDTDHVRDMLGQMLELDGFELAGSARRGKEAIELLPSSRADIVIIDYKMPDMDGITATKQMRAFAPDIPVILYTAYLDDEIETAAREAGVNACVGKIEGIASLEHEISALCLELVDK
jgi:DNA-binding NarL/FixJ family response regulator